jgi:hypothetical protein
MSRLRFSSMCVFLLAVSACSADPPVVRQFDAGPRRDQLSIPDKSVDCSQVPKLSAPTISSHDPVTSQTRYPIRGKAPAGAVYVIATLANGTTTAPVTVGASGDFCIDVDLDPGANVISITAFDQNSCDSHVASTQIQQKAGPHKDAGPTTEVINVARNKQVSSDQSPNGGQGTQDLQSLVDGDISSWFRIDFWDPEVTETCDKFAWLLVPLGKTFLISRIKIHWAPQVKNNYAKCFSLLLSDSASPADPNPTSPDWVVGSRTTAGERRTSGYQHRAQTRQVGGVDAWRKRRYGHLRDL